MKSESQSREIFMSLEYGIAGIRARAWMGEETEEFEETDETEEKYFPPQTLRFPLFPLFTML